MKRLMLSLAVGVTVEAIVWLLPDGMSSATDAIRAVLLLPSWLATPFLRFGERAGFVTIFVVPGVVYAAASWLLLFARDHTGARKAAK